MNFLGVRLNVLIGPDPVAAPAPLMALDALQDVEVTHSDRERSGFRLSFALGRSGLLELLDYDLVANPVLQPGARVILTVYFDVKPRVIMDGIVKRRDVVPGDEPGQGRLVLTGDDISVALDREVRKAEHPGQDETVIAGKIALSYPQYQLAPVVIPPVAIDPPVPLDRTPQQNCTDWNYLKRMAGRFGHVTYVEAGPVPYANRLYWGPPIRPAAPQKALNVNLGPLTNVSNISFADDALSTTLIESSVKDRITNKDIPVLAIVPTRTPLGLVPTTLARSGSTRVASIDTSGLNAMQAFARAQAALDASSDDAVTVTGTLDSLKYNDVLRAREPVDLRGAGVTFDGTYLVRSVTHRIARGSYTQDFSLSRAELGAKLPFVRVA
jgi:hypothetical protein